MNRRTLLNLIVAAVIMSIAAAAALGDSISLRSSIEVVESADVELRLSDVAELNGPMAEALADFVVVSAGDDRPTRLAVDDVRRALESANANLAPIAMSGNRVRINWRHRETEFDTEAAPVKQPDEPTQTIVLARDIVAEPTIRGRIAAEIALNRLARNPAEVEFTFDIDPALERPVSGLAVEILPQGTLNAPQLPILVRLYEDERLVESLHVVISIRTRERVLVAEHYLRRGSVIGVSDVREEVQWIPPHPAPPAGSLDEVVGSEASGRIVKDQIVRAADVAPPLLIKRNQEVLVRVRAGQLMIRMRARALEEGRLGDVIRVRRLSDRMEFTVRVESSTEVVAQDL